MKKLILFAMSMVFAFGLVACGNSDTDTNKNSNDNSSNPAPTSSYVKDENTIVLGTNPEFPPFEYVDDNGDVDGFDIAIMNAIGEKLGKKVEVVSMEFKSLIGSMESGSLDAIAAGMTVTKDRQRSVNFSNNYYTANQYIIVNKDSSISSFDSLAGMTIGVQEGTTGDTIATEEINAKEVKRFKKGVDAVMDLKNGSVDAVVIDSNPAREFVKVNQDTLKLIETKDKEEFYAIAVNKNNEQLLNDINKALDEIKKDGTFDNIVTQYIVN